MGLEDILSEIEKKRELEVAKTLNDAKAQAAKIIEEAKADAASKSAASLDKAEFEAKQITARELSKANIEAKRLYYDALSQKLDSAYSMLMQDISEYRNSDQYKKLLQKLYDYAITTLGPDADVIARKEDIAVIRKAHPKAKITEADASFLGGLVAQSKDGRIELDYNMETIMQSIMPKLYSKFLALINDKK